MYAIELTKEGDRLRAITPRENGLLTLVKADYDAFGNRVDGVFKIIHGWR